MKKVLSIIAMATLAVLFCGCNKENAPATGSKSVTISASMPDDEITTKTDLNGTKLTWNANDKIYVSAPDDAETWAGASLPIIPSSISEKGEMASFIFLIPSPSAWENAKVVVGYYGIKAQKANDYANGGWYAAYQDATYGDTEDYLMYINPCVQEYYKPIGPNGDYLAMAGPTVYDYNREQKTLFHFHNLMSIIKIPVSSRSTRTLSSIMVQCDGEPLSGGFWAWRHRPASRFPAGTPHNFSAVPNNGFGTGELIAEDFSKGTYGGWVKLKDINVTLNESAQYFYLVVFPGNHGTLAVGLTDTDGKVKAVKWTTPLTMDSGHIYKFPTINWD